MAAKEPKEHAASNAPNANTPDEERIGARHTTNSRVQAQRGNGVVLEADVVAGQGPAATKCPTASAG